MNVSKLSTGFILFTCRIYRSNNSVRVNSLAVARGSRVERRMRGSFSCLLSACSASGPSRGPARGRERKSAKIQLKFEKMRTHNMHHLIAFNTITNYKRSLSFTRRGSSRASRRGSQLITRITTPRPARPGPAGPHSLAPAPSWQDPSWQDPSERCGIHLLPVNLVKC